MTAVVAILNKEAVVIAADSAVTIGSGEDAKIFNRANKIFTLSKHNPVAVMIYDSSYFMGVPWEVIIKLYRKKLANKTYKTVKEYQINFISFLKGLKLTKDALQQDVYIYWTFRHLISRLIVTIRLDYPQFSTRDSDVANVLTRMQEYVDTYIDIFTQNTINTEFSNFTMTNLLEFDSAIKEFLNDCPKEFGFTPDANLESKLKDLVLICLCRDLDFANQTGLVFVGFGEDEIFPSIVPTSVSCSIKDRLKYYVDKSNTYELNQNSIGIVCPFGQTDVIHTILTGSDPDLDQAFQKNFESALANFKESIVNNIDEPYKSIINGLDIDSIAQTVVNDNNQTKVEKYITPMRETLNSLSKEDLAEMAESLIYSTYLKRRMTNKQESVGGPVDVAVISKGDGFVWIKRKFYFDGKLNPHFLENYLNC